MLAEKGTSLRSIFYDRTITLYNTHWEYANRPSIFRGRKKLRIFISCNGDIVVHTISQNCFQHFLSEVLQAITFGKYRDFFKKTHEEKYNATEQMNALCEHDTQQKLFVMENALIYRLFSKNKPKKIDDIKNELLEILKTLDQQSPIWPVVLKTNGLLATFLYFPQDDSFRRLNSYKNQIPPTSLS